MHSRVYPASTQKKKGSAKVESMQDFLEQREYDEDNLVNTPSRRKRKSKTVIVPEEGVVTGREPKSKYQTLYPKNKNQAKYLESIQQNIITIATGAAGTGKTLFPLYYGFKLLEQREIEKIYYIKPYISCRWEKDIGATPGDLKQKLQDNLLDPVKSNLTVFMSAGEARYQIEKQNVEAKLFTNIKGDTFRNCLAILDEAQDVPPEAILAFLTRMGENSKMIICGDTRQRYVKDNITDGLTDAKQRLSNTPDIGIVEFTIEDIVRHGLIKTILGKYYS